MWNKILFTLILVPIIVTKCQIINRPPHFVPGSGDMSRFSLSEDTDVGSPVYQLRGIDPEGGALRYSISGPVFSVDRDTGVIRLRQELDRETQSVVEVIISITDESVSGTEPNTISLRREIPIRDYNDNPPVFIGRPYSASISEASRPGMQIEVKPNIIVTDKDDGVNADVKITCSKETNSDIEDICDVFEIVTEKISDGKFGAVVRLKRALDFETQPSYILTLRATDSAVTNPLTAFATLAINVIDIQDQPPVFISAPYSTSMAENTIEGTSILTITAKDGDTGSPRPLHLTLENEKFGHFMLKPVGNPGDGRAILYTTSKPIDRENSEILQNGGVYSFTVRATELINNEVPGDTATSQVTIVVTDIDDHLPKFSESQFEISIPENLEPDTPLPGLSIFAVDEDLGANSRYNLSLRNIQNSEGVFAVTPLYGEGRTPIVVKVLNSETLDYDVEDESLHLLIFELIASVNGEPVATTQITVHLQDANDNSPVFEKSSYTLDVRENSKIGFKIENLAATDRDSGNFGKLSYLLKGFGAEYFTTNVNFGGIYVQRNLNYELQKSYILTLAAIDGGGRETNANLLINVLDVNDNHPMFETLEYTRTIREGAAEFEPQFFVRATDEDGPSQGGGRVTYSIDSENSISGHVFSINADTGEITINKPVSSMDTERGQYDLIVSATDHGNPPLKNDTRVLIRVGISGNQRPIFKGHFSSLSKNSIPGPPSYRVAIPENSQPGQNVTTVSASDPDGLDSLIQYRIVGAGDNFVINERTGLISVSTHSRLDRDTNPHDYEIIVNAVDAGFPIPETATATVYVKIKDVNDKPPKFTTNAYTAHVSERTEIGTAVLVVTATDSDLDSEISYSLIEPTKAALKTGTQLTSTIPYDYTSAFRIDNVTGEISVNNTLDYNSAAVIILTVEARDLNATLNKDKQIATAEATLYIQSFKDTNPIFKHRGWTSSLSTIPIKIKEEVPIGSPIHKISADDPVADEIIRNFQIIIPDPFGIFDINQKTGELFLLKRLDYETLNQTNLEFTVKATSRDGLRQSTASVNVTIENVNDNDPIFDENSYHASVKESERYPYKIIQVSATDQDAIITENDRKIGFSSISFSLSGPNAALFVIDNQTGVIQIAPNQTLDREKQSVLKIVAIAEDAPGKPTESRKTAVEITIDVLDVNDNPPHFTMKSYTAVIPENAPLDTFVVNMTAEDPDEGLGGEVHYDFLTEGEANGLLKINSSTGEIRSRIALTGKGRSEPYDLVIRAQDNGGQVPKGVSLYMDVSLILYIGDVSSNDGVPFFIAPKVGQIANISENATIGSPVFQVIASDPDNPATPSGQLQYKIQDDIEDAKVFRIESSTGLVTTLKPLDRETKSSYNIIVEVTDQGRPPQAATIVLHINVMDIDDHKPRFVREFDAQPLEVMILEEQVVGTIIANISGMDEDIGENGAIDYMFIDGNELNLFKISRTVDNQGIITTAQRIDREKSEYYLLTVKCFKYKTQHDLIARKTYSPYDLSEIRVVVKVVDVDDHLPEFDVKDQTVGIRLNIPVDTQILTVRATDDDPDALRITYSLENVTFVPQYFKKANKHITKNLTSIFDLNSETGVIKNIKFLSDFVDGYFELLIRANNSENPKRHRDNLIKIYVIRDRSLLRFVFTKPASEVTGIINEFTNKMQSELKTTDLELHVFDTQVLIKPDHSLDFSSSSSCFQLSRHGTVLPPHEMLKIMDSAEIKNMLTETYIKFSVIEVELCSVRAKAAATSIIASTGTWLVILSALIGLVSFIALISICCMRRKYRRKMRKMQHPILPPPAPPTEIYSTGTPVIYAEPLYGPL